MRAIVYYLADTHRVEPVMPKTKIPKTIAGVKVPKELRKAGNKLIDKAHSPEGRQAIATGLTMAAAAMAAATERRARKTAASEAPAPDAPEAPRPPEPPKPPTPPSPPEGIANPMMLGTMIGDAVEQAMKRAFGPR